MMLFVSYLVHIDTLLQNARYIITKCGSYFITKCKKNLLQNTGPYCSFLYDLFYSNSYLMKPIALLIANLNFQIPAAIFFWNCSALLNQSARFKIRQQADASVFSKFFKFPIKCYYSHIFMFTLQIVFRQNSFHKFHSPSFRSLWKKILIISYFHSFDLFSFSFTLFKNQQFSSLNEPLFAVFYKYGSFI